MTNPSEPIEAQIDHPEFWQPLRAGHTSQHALAVDPQSVRARWRTRTRHRRRLRGVAIGVSSVAILVAAWSIRARQIADPVPEPRGRVAQTQKKAMTPAATGRDAVAKLRDEIEALRTQIVLLELERSRRELAQQQFQNRLQRVAAAQRRAAMQWIVDEADPPQPDGFE